MFDKFEKALDKTAAQKEKFAQAVFKQTDKYESNYNKGEDVYDKLEEAIKEFEKTAKSLGVDVPLGKYEQSLKSFASIPRDALGNLNFDY